MDLVADWRMGIDKKQGLQMKVYYGFELEWLRRMAIPVNGNKNIWWI